MSRKQFTKISIEKSVKESGKTFPVDLKDKLDAYNIIWNSPSENSAGSMPIGNGDLSANVWVEKNGKLYFYIGKTDTWSEATRLLKVGKVCVEVTPNPFEDGNPFMQTLKLHEGEIYIKAGAKGQEVVLRVWADANHPTIRVEVTSDKEVTVDVSTEIWREKEIPLDTSTRNSWGFWKTSYWQPKESADVIVDKPDRIEWYHRNAESFYTKILEGQNLPETAEKHKEGDPYRNRTFGACIRGDGFTKVSHTTLQGKGKQAYNFSVYAYTGITDTKDEWEEGLAAVIKEDELDFEMARKEHQIWWAEFWNRSWIFVSGDEQAETVTRGYQLQRYMQGIQGRGAYPMKFNGGTLTFDFKGENADYRQWGAPYWFQNTRHQYWNMLASGDFEMMQPFFHMYWNMLELQKDMTKEYYGHEGAFFIETTNIFGGYTLTDFMWSDEVNNGVETNNPFIRYYWQSGLELSVMMLMYYEYTKDTEFLMKIAVPFAEQVIRFYYQHYPKENGVLKITPSHSLETYWDGVVNASEQVAGLNCVLSKLLDVREATEKQISEWQEIYDALPVLPKGIDGDKTYLEVAEQYNPHRSNMENPELYAIFPYQLYTVGKEDLETAVTTFERRIQRNNHCWHQNGIHAAYLGLTADAKESVISHFSQSDESVRFPGFWPEGNDWMPDLDNGGSAMTALQAMVVQSSGDEMLILPAWPAEWSVDSKLHVLDNGIVRIRYNAENGGDLI